MKQQKFQKTNQFTKHTKNNRGMKTTSIISLAMMLFASVFFLTGCQKNDTTQNASIQIVSTDLSHITKEIKNDAIEYYGKVITISDFPVEKLLDESHTEKVNSHRFKSTDVGGTPENALVPLTFDKNGVLYTAKRFNRDQDIIGKKIREHDTHEKTDVTDQMINDWFGDGDSFTYSTDLQTFYQVTKLKEATVEYVDVVGNVRSFDPYATFFEKTSEKLR